MNSLSGCFSAKQSETAISTTTVIEKPSDCVLTSRLPSPGSRIAIRTTEDKLLYLSKEDLVHIKSLRRMADDLKVDENGELTIPVPISLSAEQLDKVVLWCRASRHPHEVAVVSERLFPFTTSDVHQLLEFIEIAQFLDIVALVELLSERVAALLVKMDVATMKKVLAREDKTPCTVEELAELDEIKGIFKNPEKEPNPKSE